METVIDNHEIPAQPAQKTVTDRFREAMRNSVKGPPPSVPNPPRFNRSSPEQEAQRRAESARKLQEHADKMAELGEELERWKAERIAEAETQKRLQDEAAAREDPRVWVERLRVKAIEDAVRAALSRTKYSHRSFLFAIYTNPAERTSIQAYYDWTIEQEGKPTAIANLLLALANVDTTPAPEPKPKPRKRKRK